MYPRKSQCLLVRLTDNLKRWRNVDLVRRSVTAALALNSASGLMNVSLASDHRERMRSVHWIPLRLDVSLVTSPPVLPTALMYLLTIRQKMELRIREIYQHCRIDHQCIRPDAVRGTVRSARTDPLPRARVRLGGLICLHADRPIELAHRRLIVTTLGSDDIRLHAELNTCLTAYRSVGIVLRQPVVSESINRVPQTTGDRNFAHKATSFDNALTHSPERRIA